MPVVHAWALEQPERRVSSNSPRAWVHLENGQIPDVGYKIAFHAVQCPFAFWWCLHMSEYCQYPDFHRLVLLGPVSCSVPGGRLDTLHSHVRL